LNLFYNCIIDGNLLQNNPFLIPENELDKPSAEPEKVIEPLKPAYQPRKAGTPIASPAKVDFRMKISFPYKMKSLKEVDNR